MGDRPPAFDVLGVLRAALKSTDPRFVEGMSSTDRLVWMGVLVYADGDKGTAHPSLATIAEGTGLNRRTVSRSLGRLEDAGLIRRRHRTQGGRPTSSVYTLAIPNEGTGPISAQDPYGQGVPGVGAQDPHDMGTESHYLLKGTTKELPNDMSKRLWAVWLEELGGSGRQPKLTDQRRRLLDRLHAEQLSDQPDPVATFRQICRAVKASPHHMATRAYQLPESLFRSAERRERWTLTALDGPTDRPEPRPRPASAYRDPAAGIWDKKLESLNSKGP